MLVGCVFLSGFGRGFLFLFFFFFLFPFFRFSFFFFFFSLTIKRAMSGLLICSTHYLSLSAVAFPAFLDWCCLQNCIFVLLV